MGFLYNLGMEINAPAICTADTDEEGCECAECAAFWAAQDAQVEAEINAESAYEAANDRWAGEQE